MWQRVPASELPMKKRSYHQIAVENLLSEWGRCQKYGWEIRGLGLPNIEPWIKDVTPSQTFIEVDDSHIRIVGEAVSMLEDKPQTAVKTLYATKGIKTMQQAADKMRVHRDTYRPILREAEGIVMRYLIEREVL